MRVLAVILYLVIFALNAIPDNHHNNGGLNMVLSSEFSNKTTCDHQDKRYDHNSTHNHNNHNEGSGLCSPFCIDDCCSTPVVTSVPVCVETMIYEDYITENDFININYQYLLVDTSTPPPKTV